MTDAIFLLLGTNLGDRHHNLQSARQLIETRIDRIFLHSSIYETAAWGLEDQPAFLNQVVVLHSTLSPLSLLKELQDIEQKIGRVRHIKWGERIIDIDILYYGALIYDHPDLKIPHPEIAKRRFTLVPLTEVAPDFVHPVINSTNEMLLNQCSDQLPVKIYKSVAFEMK